MSFSSDCKEELCRLPLEKACCRLSEVAALYMCLGRLSLLGQGRVNVQFTVESAAIARRIFSLLQKELGLTAQIHYVTHARFGGVRKCVLTLGPNQSPQLLARLSMMEMDAQGQPVLLSTSPRLSLHRGCCMRAFLRGAMLGCGSVSRPDKAYRVELSLQDDALRQALAKCLQRFSLPVRQSQRKDGGTLLYLTQAEQVSTFLTLVGAHQAVITLEELRVQREVLEGVNRALNCDNANLQKQMDASSHQLEQIRQLWQSDRFAALPLSLQEIAEARMQAPDATLQQLGQMLNPPLGKSGVNHRMRRLMDYAREAASPVEAPPPAGKVQLPHSKG